MEGCEGGGTPLKLGITRVDNEGGLLIWVALFGQGRNYTADSTCGVVVICVSLKEGVKTGR